MRGAPLALLLAACRPVMAPVVPAPERDPSEAWEDLLARVVTPGGVDYDLLEAERGALDAYVAWIARPRARRERDAPRHAFALNAFNALGLFAVLQDGRPASVVDRDGWLWWEGSGFFYERAFLLEGQPTSLHEVEHEWLRGKVMDYRDHAALHVPARSSPPLRPELYVQGGLGPQLDDQMARWVADDVLGVRVEGDVAVFSAVFAEHAWDFEFLTAGDDLCTTAARFAVGEKKAALERLARAGCPTRFMDVDTSLDDAG